MSVAVGIISGLGRFVMSAKDQTSNTLRVAAQVLNTGIVVLRAIEPTLPDGCTREVVRAAMHHVSLSMTVLNQEAVALDRYPEEEEK